MPFPTTSALLQALKEFKAEGGDVVFLDHRSGELLALASRSESGAVTTASVFTGAFQPGSTAKPFTAAALLALRRVESTETVSGENGEWTYPTAGGHTRTIHDTHAQLQPVPVEEVGRLRRTPFHEEFIRSDHCSCS